MEKVLGWVAFVDVDDGVPKLEDIRHVLGQRIVPAQNHFAAPHLELHPGTQWGTHQQLGAPLWGFDVFVKDEADGLGPDFHGPHFWNR